MKSLSLTKVIAKVKVDNRQTNKQTGQKQYAPPPPHHSIRGHKKLSVCRSCQFQILLDEPEWAHVSFEWTWQTYCFIFNQWTRTTREWNLQVSQFNFRATVYQVCDSTQNLTNHKWRTKKSRCVCVCVTLCPQRQLSPKSYFLASRSKSRSRGHWPWCHWKGPH